MTVQRLLWWAMAVVCLSFAPIAAEFYWVNESGGLATYARLLSMAVSERYALGSGSGIEVMTPHWRSMADSLQVVLGVHAVLASVALCIGPFLFVERIRRTRARLHRRLGLAYVALVVPAMVLSMVYLAATPAEKIYGGAPFAVGLWGIAVLTLYTVLVGAWHIVRGELEAHRSVMILNFAAMLIAPMLRLWWGILGLALPGASQAETHVVALQILGLETFIGALVVVHATRTTMRTSEAIERLRRSVLARLGTLLALARVLGGLAAALALYQGVLSVFSPGWAPPRALGSTVAMRATLATDPQLFIVEGVLAATLLVYLPTRLRGLFGRGTAQPLRGLWVVIVIALHLCLAWLGKGLALGRQGAVAWGDAGLAVVLAVALFVCTVALAYGVITRRADLVRAFMLHTFALLLAPAALLMFQLLFLRLGFAAEDAFLSGCVLAPTLTLSASYYYTAYGGRTRSFVGEVRSSTVSTQRNGAGVAVRQVPGAMPSTVHRPTA